MASPKLNRNPRKNLKPLNPYAKPFSLPAPPLPPQPSPAAMRWTAALGMSNNHGNIQYFPSYKQCLQYNTRAQPQIDYKSSSLVYKQGAVDAEVTGGEKFVGKKKVVHSSDGFRKRCSQSRSFSSDRREKKWSLKWSPTDSDKRLISGKTTLMVKNIPNKLSRENLVDLLDEHCRQENQKAMWGSDPSPSEFDFVYLPMDFEFNLNLGYAFVNFTTAMASLKFCRFLNGCKWRGFSSNKKCAIGCARIQGKQALLQRFKNSNFICHTHDYMPVVFGPPRNGCNSLTPPKIVGKHAPLYRVSNTNP